MNKTECDIAVIGAGAAGLSAAAEAAANGANVLVLDRENTPGGVLLQCIHNGFGVHFFKEELTGPEYAERITALALKNGAAIKTGHSVMAISEIAPDGYRTLTVYSKAEGVTLVRAKAVILAMGCRERCRGNIGTPGDRTAGIYTAGLAQRMINMEGRLPGKTAVIVGSGDIGLIMARRLTWSGIKVKLVTEILPYPSGLSRNIAQCLDDFGIPLRLSTAVIDIRGRDRVESVTVAPLGPDGKPILAEAEKIECDTVLFSVGLIPENELSHTVPEIRFDPVTKGACVDSRYMTGAANIFACGNVLHVHDLVDFASSEAISAAHGALQVLRGEKIAASHPVKAGENLSYTVPASFDLSRKQRFFMRSRKVCSKAVLRLKDQTGKIFFEKTLLNVRPAEMIAVEPGPIENCEGVLEFSLEVLK